MKLFHKIPLFFKGWLPLVCTFASVIVFVIDERLIWPGNFAAEGTGLRQTLDVLFNVLFYIRSIIWGVVAFEADMSVKSFINERTQNWFHVLTFDCECHTDQRSTPLSYIFNALSRDTLLGHVQRTQPHSQIAKYPNIWLIWLFDCAQKTWPSGVSLKRALKV